VRRFGLIVLAAQFIGLAIWSAELSSHFALGSDFLGYGQAWFQMAHGHLNPYVSGWGEKFLSDHGSFVTILLAPLWWIWPHAVTLLWAQSAAIVVGELVAFIWMCEVALEFSRGCTPPALSDFREDDGVLTRLRRHLSTPTVLALLGLIILVGNPWMYWSASFDYHLELLGGCFAMLLAYDVAHHRKRAWLWLILTALSGDVAITYIFGVGLSALVAGRAWRRWGITLVTAPIVAFGLVDLFGLTGGSQLLETYLPGTSSTHPTATGFSGWRELILNVFAHPGLYLSRLKSNLVNIYANVVPAGGLGLFCAWGFGVPLVVLLQNGLTTGDEFSLTSFQNFPVYLFVAFGTVLVLSRIAVRRTALALILCAVIAVSTLGWAATWLPKTSSTWLRVSDPAAALLNKTLANLPPNAEVVASHGVIGAFSERLYIYQLDQAAIPISRRHTWFIVAPSQGINVETVQAELARISWLAGPLNAKLIAQRAGVWVFELTTPAIVKSAGFPSNCDTVPAWAVSGAAARPYLHGPSSNWSAQSNGSAGYVVSGDYWRLAAGNYVAGVRARANSPFSVQIWDADRGVLVAERNVPRTYGDQVIQVPFVAPPALPFPATQGVGPFRVQPNPPPDQDQLEVRIYSAGRSAVAVSSVTVLSASDASEMAKTALAVC